MDLRSLIDQLDGLGELARVDGADWDAEIGAITELSDEWNGPALLFDRIRGYPPGYRVTTNLIAAPKRLAAAFGFGHAISNIELVRQIKEKFEKLTPIPPVLVAAGPILENTFEGNEIDLLRFPAPKWHEQDGGRFLGTGDMVIMRDPEANWVNVGTYRVQLYDRDTLGLYASPGHHSHIIGESYWKNGQSCPVAAVFGAHPLVWIPAFLAFPWGVEEFGITGGLQSEPLPVVSGEYTGLPIPAWAEIAVEGECPPPQVESRAEGPFGEWPGYYASGTHDEVVIKVKRVMYREAPIILGSPPLKPPASGTAGYIIRAGSIWHELERLGIPGIRGVWNMRAGGSRFICVVSLEQKYAGHAKQVAMAAMSGPEGGHMVRFVIVVDEDIDPSNHEDVLWAVATRCDPATGIEIFPGCWSALLDPVIEPEQKAKGDLTNSRATVLACRPYHWRNEFPRVNRASDQLRDNTLKKWQHLFA